MGRVPVDAVVAGEAHGSTSRASLTAWSLTSRTWGVTAKGAGKVDGARRTVPARLRDRAHLEADAGGGESQAQLGEGVDGDAERQQRRGQSLLRKAQVSRPDGMTALFVDGFARMVKAGRVQAPGARNEFAAFVRAPGLEALLKLFACVNTDSIWAPSPFTLDGRQMRQMLIQADVFEALASDVPTRAPGYEALEQQLHGAPIDPLAREMFEEVIIGDDDLRLRASVALTRVAALDAWLAARDRTWAPGDETGQFYRSIDLEFALAARRNLAAHPALVRVIDGVIAELEREAEEDRRHQAWRDRVFGRS